MKIKIREPINSVTHLIGAILSVIGLIFLLKTSIESGEILKIVVSCIFSAGLIGLYLTSSIYHSVFKNITFFRKMDHMMIYVLIAASYTPICLITLKGYMGGILMGIIWTLAVVGGILKFFWLNAPRWLYTGFYLLLGWAAIFVIYPLYIKLPHTAVFLLVFGGVLYSLGAIIYATKFKWMKIGAFGFHEIFHIFIMLGSLNHFIMVYNFIIK